MLANQKMVGKGGLQNILFPLPYLYITQGENGEYVSSPSHRGTLAIDYIGWSSRGRVYKAPYYAPCDMVCTGVWSSWSGVAWSSQKKVNWIDGTQDFVTVRFVHDNVSGFKKGQVVKQGALIGHTGTYYGGSGKVGDHADVRVYRGSGTTAGNKEVHQYNVFGVNDTVLQLPRRYNWRKFTVTAPTPTPEPPKVESAKLNKVILQSTLDVYKGVNI